MGTEGVKDPNSRARGGESKTHTHDVVVASLYSVAEALTQLTNVEEAQGERNPTISFHTLLSRRVD